MITPSLSYAYVTPEVHQCIHAGALGRASMTATLDSDCSEATIAMKIAHDTLAMTDNTTQNVES